eukprot:11648906-Ditylum_brightwellii.AAC.1
MHMANNVYNCSTQEQLIKFYHITMFSPVKKVLFEVARHKYLRGWPGFTQAAIRKHIDVKEATVKGNLNQASQGVRSTRVEEPECKQEPGNQKHVLYLQPCPTRVERFIPTRQGNF